MEEFKRSTSQESVTVTTSESVTPQFKDTVVLIVNTASECGFTSQYAGLQKLYTQYKDRGLTVIAYPSNNFGNQEPGTNEEISNFCKVNYGVTFPVMPKCEVIGESDPTYKKLYEVTGVAPKWNFHKYLVTANQVSSFDHFTTPEDLDPIINKLLGK